MRVLFVAHVCAALLLAAAGFVKTAGTAFTLDGAPFRFAGTNNYYLSYQDSTMVEDVFSRARAHNFSVLRTWAFLDIGRPDGSASVGGGPKNGVWFQALDPVTNTLVYNESGLAHLDNVLAIAARYGVKLILTLTNNWVDFGGMDQYVRWEALANASYAAENPKHDDFYARPWQRTSYAAWVTRLATRTNSVTGVAYKDDPTIFSWELANEPRCQGSGAYGSSNNCTLNYAKFHVQPVAWKITSWVDFASAAIKAADPNHLVAVGDEGFLCETYQDDPDMTGDCYVGTDFAAFTALPTIDFGSAHLYPDSWGGGKGVEWGMEWIANHTAMAHALGKPMLLGEFGLKQGQAAAYAEWGAAWLAGGLNGDLFWMLCGRQDYDTPWYPDYDGSYVAPEGPRPAPNLTPPLFHPQASAFTARTHPSRRPPAGTPRLARR
jgi:mannan endo-1,4-beta-mannosidase